MEDVIFTQFDSLALRFVWGVTAVLFLVTTYLFIASVLVRKARDRESRFYEEQKEKYYPVVISALVGDEISLDKLKPAIHSDVQIRPFVDIIIEYLNNVEGLEYARLQKLLIMPEIREFYYNLINSRQNTKITEGCMYFARLKDLKQKELHELEKHVESKNQLIAHSAATGLMSSSKVQVRTRALRSIVSRTRISKMAILEMMYLYHHGTKDQLDEESAGLLSIIDDKHLPTHNKAQIIKGISDLGYVNLALPLFERLEYLNLDDSDPEIVEALIHSLGNFGFSPITEIIREKLTQFDSVKVRNACVHALEQFDDPGNSDLLEIYASDEQFNVRIKALYALAKLGDKGAPVMDRLREKSDELAGIIETITLELNNP